MENKHWCYMCRKEKNSSEFNKDKSRASGIGGRCKPCQREVEKKYYKQRDKKKIDARSKLNQSINKGLITRQPCEVCGEVKTEAHHDDYDKPLEVRWVCQKHHQEHHKNDIDKEPKKYKKNPTRLFQVRLSEKEYVEVVEHFKNLEVTRRVWLLSKLKTI